MPGSRDPFLERLYLSVRDLISIRRRVILAVSGGADSMALLLGVTRLNDRLKAQLRVVTVDHGLSLGSAREAQRVKARARELGVECRVKRLRLKRGPAVEARARDARYRALESERRKGRFDWVATAHTASDQAETLLMRLSRGAALTGAASILERRDRVVRPLLFATRREVREWLKGQGERWHEDPMNGDAALLRTRIRTRVLPPLERATDPRVTLRLARFARLASDDDALLQTQADGAYRQLRRSPTCLDARGLTSLAPALARRVLARWLKELELPVDGELIERMRQAAAESGVTALPKRKLLKCRRGKAMIVIE